MAAMNLYAAVEDELSQAVLLKILENLTIPITPVKVLCKGGNGYLRSKVSNWAKLAMTADTAVVVLTDLDRTACPIELKNDWLNGVSVTDRFCLRIAVRSIESWLLSDRDALAEFFNVASLPHAPDDLPEPKTRLLIAAKRAKKEIRQDLIKLEGAQISQGMSYNNRMSKWVNESWDPLRASQNSPSLLRTINRLNTALCG